MASDTLNANSAWTSNINDVFKTISSNIKYCRVTRYLQSGKSKSSTGNLTRHLEKEHADIVVLGEFEEEDEFVSA